MKKSNFIKFACFTMALVKIVCSNFAGEDSTKEGGKQIDSMIVKDGHTSDVLFCLGRPFYNSSFLINSRILEQGTQYRVHQAAKKASHSSKKNDVGLKAHKEAGERE